jgi:hypothetical protein
MDTTCTKCGSDKIIPDVAVFDKGHQNFMGRLMVGIHGNPKALLFKQTSLSPLTACICGVCGYTELIAKDPEGLYKAYQKAKQ